ncbi:MAG: tetratricopeptide repeat protein [Deltaproteobacteria bacterium]|nr:tetratricopeptide repeat protein [Deltaproteobacteria bacterium]
MKQKSSIAQVAPSGRADAQMSRRAIAVVLVVLALASAGAYANSLKGQFVWDDLNLIVLDHQIRSFSFIKDVFTRDFFGFQDNARKYGYYRPLITISYMVDYKLWKLDPAGYHATNVLTHIIATSFVFLIFLRIFGGKPLGPTIGALLFAVHPIHTESVTWISGRTDTICAQFFFIALWAFMVFADRFASARGIHPEGAPPSTGLKIHKTRWLVGSCVAFLLALLSKEMAIFLPLVLLLYVFVFHTGFSWRRILPFLPIIGVYILVVAGYSLYRYYVIEFSTQAKDPWGVVTTVISFIWTVGYYLAKMAWPVYQTGYIQNELVTSVFSPKVLVSLGVIGALVWAAWTTLRTDRAVSFSILFLLSSFGPLSNFIRISGPKDMGFMTAERFAYVPSAPFLILVGVVAARLMGRAFALASDRAWGTRAQRAVAVALVAAMTAGYGFLCVERNKKWYDNEVFFQDCLAKATSAPLLYMMLGNIYSMSGKYDEAERMLRTAIEYLSPRDREEPTWIYSDLAGVYAKQGQYDKALEMMKLASRGHMHNSAVEFNTGEIYRMMGDEEKAIDYYQRSLKIDRSNVKAMEQAGLVLQQLGRWGEANRWYTALAKYLPNSPRVQFNIGRNYMMQRENRSAVPHLEKAIELSPRYASAYVLLGNAYVNMDKASEGIQSIQKALEIEPENAEARASLGNALFAVGKKKEAHEELKAALKVDPDNVTGLLGMGILAADQGHDDIAERTFARVLKQEPANVKALLSLGILNYNRKNAEFATRWFERVLAAEPGNNTALTYLARLGVSKPAPSDAGGAPDESGEATKTPPLDAPPEP